MRDPNNAATLLEGLVIDGWTVGALIEKKANDTGGCFSQCYRLTNARGELAFLKALDFYRAFSRPGADMTKVVQNMSTLFNYERDLFEICGERNMDRVVKAIGSGTVSVSKSPYDQVPYLIFESAERDIRNHLDAFITDDVKWRLRALHHIATGLKQLHSAGIVHQDLKPSNVLVFAGQAPTPISKLADLGRATRQGAACPHDHYDWPGDPAYMPPEFQYGYIETDWSLRRISADIYLLGSMMCFLFTRLTSLAFLFAELDVTFYPALWGGTFDDVLPYLQNAHAETVRKFGDQILNEKLRTELLPLFRQLCEPDPRKRGDSTRAMNKLALERYVSHFDRLARFAEAGKYA